MVKSLFKNVLVVVNGSAASINAVEYGVVLSKIYRCDLHAVYVVDTATLRRLTLTKFLVQDESDACEANLVEDGSRYLKYAENLAAAKGVKIATEIRKGSICSEIVAAADELRCDLILLGGFEKSGADPRDVLTSAYRQILLEAHCSVLVVKEAMVEKLYKMV